MRVVLDTNVLVSAFLKPESKPARILRLALQGDIEIVITEHILAEYLEVLERPIFSLNKQDIRVVLDFIRSKGIKAPALPEAFHLPHPDDEPFLEAALSTGADFLVTGSKRHYPKKACKGQKVLTPDEFLKAF